MKKVLGKIFDSPITIYRHNDIKITKDKKPDSNIFRYKIFWHDRCVKEYNGFVGYVHQAPAFAQGFECALDENQGEVVL